RRLIGLIWTLTFGGLQFGGLQWRTAGWLSGVPFTTLHSAFARWTRLGLWRRLGQRLALDWRLARGDEVLPSAVVADSRSLRSAPSAWTRATAQAKADKPEVATINIEGTEKVIPIIIEDCKKAPQDS